MMTLYLGLSSLHYAAMRNDEEMAQVLLEAGADVCQTDVLGRNVLDVAIDSGALKVGVVILQHEHWRRALMNDVMPCDYGELTVEQLKLLRVAETTTSAAAAIADSVTPSVGSLNLRQTPLRRMIRKMPQLALTVFDRCMDSQQGNVEFLDDTYAVWIATGKENDRIQDRLVTNNFFLLLLYDLLQQ